MISFLERFVWFDNESRRERFPNASKLAPHFEICTKAAQLAIKYFRDRLQVPLEYYVFRTGNYFTAPPVQQPVIRSRAR